MVQIHPWVPTVKCAFCGSEVKIVRGRLEKHHSPKWKFIVCAASEKSVLWNAKALKELGSVECE